MPRKKTLTEEERLQQEKEFELSNIKDKVRFINTPTYTFKAGDKVTFGNLKDATIDYVSNDKKIYGILANFTNENYGNPYDTKVYRVAA